MDEEKKSESSRGDERVPLYKLFSYADSVDVILMIVGFIAAVANGLSMPLMTVIFGQLINSFGNSNQNTVVREISKISLRFVYLAIGAGVAGLLQVSFWMITGERQSARIRSLYLRNILRQDIVFFDKETRTGEVVGRMSGDTILIQDAMGEKVGKFLQLVSTFFGGFLIAFIKGWELSLVMLSSIPLLVLAGAAMSVIVARMSSRGQIAYAEAGNTVEQTIGSIRTVVAFTGENRAIEKYEEALKQAYATMIHQGLATGLGIGAIFFVMFSSYGLAIWYGSKLIIDKNYDGGTVINVMLAIMTGGMSLGQASPCINAFTAGQAAAYKMFQTIERKPEIDAWDEKGMTLDEFRGDIELKDIYFSYPSRPDVQIFSGFSLNVPSGTIVALVGESGSGKSTVVSLVERFYDPLSGEVLIDRHNIKTLKLKWIREKIGLVSQEPVLFATTIKENIAYGKEGWTEEEIRRAIEVSNAAKFIDKMPKGLDTMVGEHGTQLSGGQKQRIAIARAILKNPKILLLDEATSALDAESERIVQDSLTMIMLDKTTVIVAHRLSTIRNADKIAVVQKGKIVEQGSHSELIKDPNGAYSQLIYLQNVSKEESSATDPDKVEFVDRGTATSKSFGRGSSLKRSLSIESSGKGSNRISFSIPFVLPGVADVIGGEQEKNEKNIIENGEPRKEVSIRRLACMNKPEIPIILLGSIFAAINGLFFPLFGILISSVIKIFFEPRSKLRKDSQFWALMYTTLGVGSFIVSPAQQYLFGVAGGKLIQRIRSLSFRKVVYQEISWFDEPENSSGAIGGRLSTDASSVRSLVGDALALMVQNISTIIAGLAIAMVANWRLALIILVLIPLIGAQGYIQIKFLKGFSEDAKVKYEEASQVANDAVSSIRTVASFCAEGRVMELYTRKCDAPMKQGVRQGLVSGIGFGTSHFLLFCTYALSFYAGARLMENGKATFPQVFRVFFALTMMAIGISQSSAMAPDATKAKESAASIFAIINRESKIDANNEEGETLDIVKGEIEFQHVSFKYPTRPDVQILKDFCLAVPSGKTVALVGESGCGKSTAIGLLERFYDPDSGKILLDGKETRKLKLRWLRQQMGLVSQEPALFNDTIRSNIAYGRQDEISEEEIIEASKAANAHNFISSLPQGYDTSVGERGMQLSGGQKQRVAIARAIVRRPKILLLDEATSALDAESEHIVQEALDRISVSRTTIVIAHRFSTIQGADVIAVVKNGVIAEKGKHEALMKMTEGLYASLVALHTSS